AHRRHERAQRLVLGADRRGPHLQPCADARGDRRGHAYAGGLDGLLHLAALEAGGADVGTLRRAVHEDADALEVRVEAPLRRDHRVRPLWAGPPPLTTTRTNI